MALQEADTRFGTRRGLLDLTALARDHGLIAVPMPGSDPAHGWHGNVLLLRGRPVCLGMTPLRLALNAELFEKCAKAYVLAVAGNGRVRPLPWIVRLVANRRLAKDRQRAAVRFVQGHLPEESNGY